MAGRKVNFGPTNLSYMLMNCFYLYQYFFAKKDKKDRVWSQPELIQTSKEALEKYCAVLDWVYSDLSNKNQN